ncbi:MAG: hypothetical protein LBU47_07750, partial [Christensenellaceae bacterium]|nr:hypothetical protein [Christensenellaceae bacterium]
GELRADGSILYSLKDVEIADKNSSGAPLGYGGVSFVFPTGLTADWSGWPAGWTANATPGSGELSLSLNSGSVSAAALAGYLEDFLRFTAATPSDYPPDGAVISAMLQAVQAAAGESTLLIGDSIHYYEYVPGNISWMAAYNAAKNRFKTSIDGTTQLQGYLVTVTSQEENRFLYASINKQRGWMGGTRMVLKSGNAKINDPNSLSTIIGDYNTGTTDWYWACGPEAGTVFFSGGLQYGASKNAQTAANAKSVPGVYQAFHNADSVAFDGSQIPPDQLAGGATRSWEPNNSSGEYCLHFAASLDLWNDYSYNATIAGYYIEWDEPLQTSEMFGASIPQPIEVELLDEYSGAIAVPGLTAGLYLNGIIGDSFNLNIGAAPQTITSPFYGRLASAVVSGESGTAYAGAALTGQYSARKQKLTIVYRGLHYTVHYVKANGEAEDIPGRGVAYGESGLLPPELAWAGHGFLGWKVTLGGKSGVPYPVNGGHAYSDLALDEFTEEITLTAQWRSDSRPPPQPDETRPPQPSQATATPRPSAAPTSRPDLAVPKTGDGAGAAPWFALLLLGLLGASFGVWRLRATGFIK